MRLKINYFKYKPKRISEKLDKDLQIFENPF